LGRDRAVTFLLVNDIYLIADQMMPDGKRRGGFPRLAAVVKAERAKGNVILTHAGDTLSPSLMSGLDRSAHILALANLITPDIFTPGLPTVTTTKDAAEALRRDGAGFVVAVVPCAPTSAGALY
jgi:5'-nucleotidase/UDP-sugar diphosphatase